MMLSQNEIEQISKFSGLRPHQQEKHYIQTVILKSIFSKFNPVFKGGTALMMIHGLNRFSEDLDFTLSDSIEIESLKENIVKDLSLLGINSIIGKSKEFSLGFSFRIGAVGPLFQKPLDRCYVYIEVSRRNDMILQPNVHGIQPFYSDLLPFSLNVMQLQEIMAEKVRAIMTRKKARDVFDFHFLVTKRIEISLDIINKKLEIYSMIYSNEEFQDRLLSFEPIWEPELKPIIIGNLPPFTQIYEKIKQFTEKIDI